MPKGSLVNLYLPNGMLNLKSLELLSSSFICQNPLLTSKTVKTVAFANLLMIPSTVCTWKCFLHIALSISPVCKHILISSQCGLSTVTIQLIHFVGFELWLLFATTLFNAILFLLCPLMPLGIYEVRGLIFMVCLPGKNPKLSNTSLYSSNIVQSPPGYSFTIMTLH